MKNAYDAHEAMKTGVASVGARIQGSWLEPSAATLLRTKPKAQRSLLGRVLRAIYNWL